MVKFFEQITILELAGWSEPLPLEALKSGIAQKRIGKNGSSLLLLELRDALGAIPLPLGLRGEIHAAKVEPLDGTVRVIAADHLTVGYLCREGELFA